jgi:hypothetical protein
MLHKKFSDKRKGALWQIVLGLTWDRDDKFGLSLKGRQNSAGKSQIAYLKTVRFWGYISIFRK